LPIRSTGAVVVVPALFAGVAATTAGSVVAGLAAALAVRGAVAAGFGEANGSEFTSRFKSLCALRATWQPDNNSNNPTPRVCLNRLFFSFTAFSPFRERCARTDERRVAHGGCRGKCHAVNSPQLDDVNAD